MAYPPGFNPKTDRKIDFREIEEIRYDLGRLCFNLTNAALDLGKRPVKASLADLNKYKKNLEIQIKKLKTNK